MNPCIKLQQVREVSPKKKVAFQEKKITYEKRCSNPDIAQEIRPEAPQFLAITNQEESSPKAVQECRRSRVPNKRRTMILRSEMRGQPQRDNQQMPELKLNFGSTTDQQNAGGRRGRKSKTMKIKKFQKVADEQLENFPDKLNLDFHREELLIAFKKFSEEYERKNKDKVVSPESISRLFCAQYNLEDKLDAFFEKEQIKPATINLNELFTPKKSVSLKTVGMSSLASRRRANLKVGLAPK
eukprot:CAMPEP_0114997526 /NCGR_PEP_ID=MMETSP0216-20121206/14951_1 /TAXON_ID=223996 /ORGANISM="Protocruzia adherens, Strain Boccale" /LENGTH=240 /DNA_ID=CAMNT_0002361923 /DNA_START=135 /DNA_END=857 /DNA_ORIENTATION=-